RQRERAALAEPATVTGNRGLPERAQLGFAATVEVACGRCQVAGVALERLVEQRRLHQGRGRAASVDRVRVVGGVADREEAGREREPAPIDEAPETVAELPHDEDGRVLARDRHRAAARAPRGDRPAGVQEAREARRLAPVASTTIAAGMVLPSVSRTPVTVGRPPSRASPTRPSITTPSRSSIPGRPATLARSAHSKVERRQARRTTSSSSARGASVTP